jgi:Tautomerase enzyme
MPLARIDLIKGKPSDYRRTIGDVVYKAMVEILKAPRTIASRSSMSTMQTISSMRRRTGPARAMG